MCVWGGGGTSEIGSCEKGVINVVVVLKLVSGETGKTLTQFQVCPSVISLKFRELQEMAKSCDFSH